MPRTKSDISNSAIRIFLQQVGEFYDEARGFKPYIPTKSQKQELLEFFNHECCYCGSGIDQVSLSQDHLIPMNKTHLGLHAWGNVVPCCQVCNNAKHLNDWVGFLEKKTPTQTKRKIREKRILDFIKAKQYDLKLNLHVYANNLYQDVGAVATTLINLRYQQAARDIEQTIKRK